MNEGKEQDGSVSADIGPDLRTSIKTVEVKLTDRRVVTFCEHCHNLYKENYKCDYCAQVYFSAADDADMDGKHWIGCDGCAKWNHTDCEIERGTNKEYREAAEVS